MEQYIHTNIYQDFDFKLLNSIEFKEDAVREELINPLLKYLGYKAYGHNRIVYSRVVERFFVKIGQRKQQIEIGPDYLFEIDGENTWILDAISPNDSVICKEHTYQMIYYISHKTINVDFYAICNGREFALFRKNEPDPIFYFELNKIELNWPKIVPFLSPKGFMQGEKQH